MGRSRWRKAACGELSLAARVSKASGSDASWSPWLIHTRRAAAEGEQRVEARDAQVRGAELLARRTLYLAAEGLTEDVHPVADAEHRRRARHEQLEDVAGRQRRALGVDARRAAREDDTHGRHAPERVERQVEGMDLAVDVQLAHAPRDQLRVLRAEVEDQDQVSTGGPSAARALRCSDAPGPRRPSVSALALGLPPFPYLLEAIVGRLLRDVDVVHVALLEPGRRDAHELGFLAQLGQ